MTSIEDRNPELEGLGRYQFGWADSDVAGAAAKRGLSEEVFWATRKLFEALARESPLMLVFEDVHWAEPTLLDLIEQLAERASGPILTVCIARSELLDERPAWAERALGLEPLAEEESVALLASLPGGDALTAAAHQRIVEVTAAICPTNTAVAELATPSML